MFARNPLRPAKARVNFLDDTVATNFLLSMHKEHTHVMCKEFVQSFQARTFVYCFSPVELHVN